MIRQLCRNIAGFFGGQGGIRNLAVIFIIVAGLLLSCCFALVAVAGNSPGQIVSVNATATAGANNNIAFQTPTVAPVTPTTPPVTPTTPPVTPTTPPVTPTTPPVTPTTPPVTPTTPPVTPTTPPVTPTTPPVTPTTPPVTPTTPPVTPTLPTCNGTPTSGVPCSPPGTGGGPGSGPQSGIANGGTLALIMVALLSLVLVAGGLAAASRVRRARGR